MSASWFAAFLLTLAIEQPVAGGLLRRCAPGSFGRLLLLVVFANLATHPLVWYVFPELPLPPALALALAELWALLGEAVFYRLVLPALSWPRALVTSLAANAASFATGLVLDRVLGGWPLV